MTTVFTLFAANGYLEVAQCWLDASADTGKAAINGVTPLHLAAFQVHQTVLQCLLDAIPTRRG